MMKHLLSRLANSENYVSRIEAADERLLLAVSWPRPALGLLNY